MSNHNHSQYIDRTLFFLVIDRVTQTQTHEIRLCEWKVRDEGAMLMARWLRTGRETERICRTLNALLKMRRGWRDSIYIWWGVEWWLIFKFSGRGLGGF